MLDIISRWTHIGTAIVLVGGTCFLRFILVPSAAASLTDEQHASLREQVINRWKKFVHGGIALFLVSGFYNFIRQIPKHRGDGLYHGLIGTKILLALAIFFIASALVGRSKSFEGMRKAAGFWQLVIILLAVIIVGISGYAKVALPPVVIQETAQFLQMNLSVVTSLVS